MKYFQILICHRFIMNLLGTVFLLTSIIKFLKSNGRSVFRNVFCTCSDVFLNIETGNLPNRLLVPFWLKYCLFLFFVSHLHPCRLLQSSLRGPVGLVGTVVWASSTPLRSCLRLSVSQHRCVCTYSASSVNRVLG